MRLTARAACAAAALALAACGTAPQPVVGPPAAVDLADVDPQVAALLTDLHRRASAEPRSGTARGRLGLAYEVNGFPHAAEQCYEEAALLDPREARWPYARATLRASQGDLAAALASIDVVVRLAPDHLPARLWAGEWLLADGRPEEAQRIFEDAARIAPRDPWVRHGLARAMLDAGNPGRAIEILEQLAAEPDPDPLALRTLGAARARAGDAARSREILARAPPGPRRPWPDPWASERHEYIVGFGARMLLADELMAHGRAAEALPILEALQSERPGEVPVAANLAVLLRSAGRADEARRILEDAVARNPDHPVLRMSLVASYELAGDPRRALEEIDAVLAAHPARADAWQKRGLLLARTGRGVEALVAFDEAASRRPEDPWPCLLGGIQAAELARWDEARKRLECAVALDPERFEAWVALGPVRASLGDRDGAQEALDRAARIRPGDKRLASMSSRAAAILAGKR